MPFTAHRPLQVTRPTLVHSLALVLLWVRAHLCDEMTRKNILLGFLLKLLLQLPNLGFQG